jgi:thiamine biosynthesis lipoprotein ApbE
MSPRSDELLHSAQARLTASAPSEEPALALAERALALADGDQAQVTVTRERSLVSRFARSRPTQATEVDDRTVEVLCVVSLYVNGITVASSRAAAEAGAYATP